jgi:hypothetical protein
VWKKKEVKKVMTSKLPWAAAAAIIVVAGLTALTFWPKPIVPGYATITVMAAPGTVFGAPIPGHSGIRAIHIMRHGAPYALTDNLNAITPVATAAGVRLGAIIAHEGTVAIPHGVPFDVVVDVRGHDDNMAFLVRENLRVRVTSTGAFAIPDGWSTDAEEENYAPIPTLLSVFANVRRGVAMNRTLLAGQTITLTVGFELWN